MSYKQTTSERLGGQTCWSTQPCTALQARAGHHVDPRSLTRAGEHDVSHARKPRERERLRSLCRREPRNLVQTARDQRGAAVATEAQPIGDAACDREHVLQRTAQLDTCYKSMRAIVRLAGDCRIAADISAAIAHIWLPNGRSKQCGASVLPAITHSPTTSVVR